MPAPRGPGAHREIWGSELLGDTSCACADLLRCLWEVDETVQAKGLADSFAGDGNVFVKGFLSIFMIWTQYSGTGVSGQYFNFEQEIRDTVFWNRCIGTLLLLN